MSEIEQRARLATEIRSALGEFNDENEAVVLLVKRLAEKARALSGSEWRPIETCPNSEEVVMFHVPGGKRPEICRSDDYWFARKDRDNGYAHWLNGSTHWMPLPAPPLSTQPELIHG